MILVTIPGTTFRLDSTANASLDRMRAQGMPVQITESYRTYETQRQRYLQYLAGGNFALRPGTSMHEQGTTIDFKASSIAWLERFGNEHGWYKTNPSEDWHWEYQAWHDQHRTTSTPPPTTTPLKQRKKVKMFHFWVKDPKAQRGAKYVILTDEGRKITYESGSQDFPNAVAANIGNAILADDALITSFQNQLRASGPKS